MQRCEALDTMMTRRQFMVFALQLMAWASLPGCRKNLPVLGRGALADVFVAEDHSRFLAHWAEKGIRDAVLVNIDTHDDFHFAPEEKISQLKDLYQRKEWQRFSEADTSKNSARGLYGIGNWIYAGMRLGIFREVYWVIPFKFLERSDALQFLQAYLEAIEFSAEDSRSFVRSGNQFRGTIRSMPITICPLEALPLITEPLLLSVDIDFFPTYVNEYKVAYLTALKEAFTGLYGQNYRIMDAAVCYSINGEFLLPQHRWVGDAVRMILKSPDLINQPVPALTNVQQQVDNEYRTTNATAMMALIKSYPAWESEPSLLLYMGLAHMQAGDAGAAFSAVLESCRADILYASALPYMGALYYSKGQYDIAERFFRAGYVANPLLSNGLFHFGNCLVKNGKLSEALGVYELDVQRNGSFPTHFMMVQTYLVLGDDQSALETLKLAIPNLRTGINTRVVSQVVADAIYTSLNFCERKHHADLAETLRKTSTFKKMRERFPR